jgi:hypothetical protein
MWLDGRTGHSTYLMFSLAIVNFILITYNFFIEGSEIFNEFITNLGIFTIIFLVFYFPVSLLIGRWHTNTQLNVDVTLKMQEDPVMAKMIRTLLDVQTGVASEEEIKEFRKQMLEIEKYDIN